MTVNLNAIAAVGPGWMDIVRRTHEQLLQLNPDYRILQIKEKFGGLRYYLDGIPYDDYKGILFEAEEEASRTCEECGQPGSLRTTNRYWYRTLCDKHEERSRTA